MQNLITAAKLALQAIDEGWLFERIDNEIAPMLRKALDQLPDATKMTADELADRIARGEKWMVEESTNSTKPVVESKPVGYAYQNELEGMELGHYPTTEIFSDKFLNGIPLYTAPPKREWQGLTNAEKIVIRGFVDYNKFITVDEYAERVQYETEKRLKEKNA